MKTPHKYCNFGLNVKAFFILLLFSITIVNTFYLANAQETIKLKISNVTGKSSEYCIVNVNMDANSQMTALTIEMAYDSSVMSVENTATDITYGSIMKGMNQSNVVGGIVKFTSISTDKITASGDILAVKFKIKSDAVSGNYPITLTVKEFATSDELYNAVNISYLVENGIVTIEGSNIATPSPTPNVTATPTPTSTATPIPSPTEIPNLTQTNTPTSHGGGSSNGSGGSAVIPTTPIPQTNMTEFQDIAGYDWAKETISALAEKGVIKGTSETTFSPSLNIKRADYLLLMIRMLGLTAEVSSNFTDVTEDKYYYKEIGIAKALGLTTGVGDNKFNPDDSISRQDMFVLASRMLKKLNKIDLKAEETQLDQFKDGSDVADYAKVDFATLIELGFVKGTDNQINPKNSATRAETAVFVYRIYNNINK